MASEVHRLLELGLDGPALTVTELLPAAVLIVDKAGMLDITLAARLLEAPPRTARLILVSDVDRLPSVGPRRAA